MCEGAFKQFPDHTISTTPPVLKFLHPICSLLRYKIQNDSSQQIFLKRFVLKFYWFSAVFQFMSYVFMISFGKMGEKSKHIVNLLSHCHLKYFTHVSLMLILRKEIDLFLRIFNCTFIWWKSWNGQFLEEKQKFHTLLNKIDQQYMRVDLYSRVEAFALI